MPEMALSALPELLLIQISLSPQDAEAEALRVLFERRFHERNSPRGAISCVSRCGTSERASDHGTSLANKEHEKSDHDHRCEHTRTRGPLERGGAFLRPLGGSPRRVQAGDRSARL